MVGYICPFSFIVIFHAFSSDCTFRATVDKLIQRPFFLNQFANIRTFADRFDSHLDLRLDVMINIKPLCFFSFLTLRPLLFFANGPSKHLVMLWMCWLQDFFILQTNHHRAAYLHLIYSLLRKTEKSHFAGQVEQNA